MARQYWIGDYYVDLSRNEICKESPHKASQPQTLPPKALLVLTYLAENPGRVVGYDELLDSVWADTVVTPNSLQRCIAQLRKALGEDSKSPVIIKTHSKQGYSLECEVTWEAAPMPVSRIEAQAVTATATLTPTPAEGKPEPGNTPTPRGKSQLLATPLISAVCTIVILLLVTQKDAPTLVQGKMRYITATDDKEFDASWSADGQFIVFHRYPEKLCINHVWAKHGRTLQEYQLTKELGTYVNHSLSPDGKNLVYIKQEDCHKPVTQNVCYRLMTLDFQQALQQPQSGRELLGCEHSAIKSPVWPDNQHIVLMQKDAQRWRLVRYSLKDASTSAFYQLDNGSIEHFSWSPEKRRFAVTTIKKGGNYSINMLTADGELLSSQQVTLAQESPKFMRLRPTFIPGSDKMLFTDRRDIYTLSPKGDVTLENFHFESNVGSPVFHPQGKRILLPKGYYDSDIARVSIAPKEHSQTNTAAPFSVFKRSIAHDDNAKFQPGSKNIAFVSQRSGSEQLWFSQVTSQTAADENGSAEKLDTDYAQPKILSNFPEGYFISNIVWNQAGTALLVLANSELYKITLGETTEHRQQLKFAADYPVLDLFHWDSSQQQVIANIQVNGAMQFVKISLPGMNAKPINNKIVKWADKSPDSPLIFMDHLNRFWQKNTLEDKLIVDLEGKAKLKARFVIHQHSLYSINKREQLWSFNLQTGEFKILGNPPPLTDYPTDASPDELLFTYVIAAKKEIVELGVRK